jgi:general secretion pathway protein L
VSYALAKVRRYSAEFVTWWFAELRAAAPSRLTRLLLPPVNELVLQLQPPHLSLTRRNGTSERPLGTIEVEGTDPEHARTALRSVLGDLDPREVQVSLQLPPELALRKVVDLPAAAEENLREVLAFEMDRLTPFSADAVYYDVRVLARDAETKRIKVELMVLPRAAADPLVEQLRRLGLQPDALTLPRRRPDGGLGTWRLTLAGSASGRRRWVSLPVLLFTLAAALLIAGVFVSLDRARRQAEILDQQVTAARQEAEEGRRLQEQIERLSGEGNFIVDRKRARPPVVEVMNELSRVLPDDTWLYRMRLMGEELQVFGYSPNASAMIGLIESGPVFSNAQFRAPLTRDQRVEAEQFHVAFRVAREETP